MIARLGQYCLLRKWHTERFDESTLVFGQPGFTQLGIQWHEVELAPRSFCSRILVSDMTSTHDWRVNVWLNCVGSRSPELVYDLNIS